MLRSKAGDKENLDGEAPEPVDDDLKPTFKSGQRLIRPGGVGYGDDYCPAAQHPGDISPAQAARESNPDVGVQDPSTLPGTSEVPDEDNYNTLIRTDLTTNPPPTRAPSLPHGHDSYDHIVLGNQGTTAADTADAYDQVGSAAFPTGDVYRMVDVSKKKKLNDDNVNQGIGSHNA